MPFSHKRISASELGLRAKDNLIPDLIITKVTCIHMQDIEPWPCQEYFVSLTKNDILWRTGVAKHAPRSCADG